MPKQVLTKKKKAWVSQYKPTAVLRGHPLAYSVALEDRYAKAIIALVKQMTSQTLREVKKLFTSQTGETWFATDANITSEARILTNAITKKFEQLFARRSSSLAESMVNDADKNSSGTLHSSLKELSGGLSLKTKFLTGDLKTVLKASVIENVSLINSIPAKYLDGMQAAVMRSITTGEGLKTLVPYLKKQEGITVRRAKNIALDQTRKAYSNLNQARMEKIGVRKFQWLHSGGSQHPRPDHVAMSGNVYSFDDLPVIDQDTGERGIPGQAINCRCQMIPVIEFNEGEEQ